MTESTVHSYDTNKNNNASYRVLKLIYHKILKTAVTGCLKLLENGKCGLISRPFVTFYMPVQQIIHKVESPLKPPMHRTFLGFRIRAVGLIVGGDWDLNPVRFCDDHIYTCFKERFREGKQWEDTAEFRRFEEFKERGLLRYDTWEKYKKYRLEYFDDLYLNIKTKGYRKQTNPEDEIQVAVSRQGHVLFIDGHHRLAIAKILNVMEVPVIVNIWHKDFIEKLKLKKNNRRISAPEAFARLRLDKFSPANQ